MIDNCADDWRIAMTWQRMMLIGVEIAICAVHPIPGRYYFLWTTKLSNHGGKIGSQWVPVDVTLSLPMFFRLYLICRQVAPMQMPTRLGMFKRNLRNDISEGLFNPRLMLHLPPILAGKCKWMRGFHRPSKMIFLRFRLEWFKLFHLLNWSKLVKRDHIVFIGSNSKLASLARYRTESQREIISLFSLICEFSRKKR